MFDEWRAENERFRVSDSLPGERGPCPYCGHKPIWFGKIVVACYCNVYDLEGVAIQEAIRQDAETA